ncbi:DUF2783 domain-containing protein [Moraxella sp. FZLJ2107]|uniref:DUF2783 domain-containing protein n=1 Tax=unclassified Moraxella TaxID=2685852 RepID=UPI0020C8E706|nr:MULTISPECIES: DUF2783 domain-containing protein [unclassified Moraxella]UTO05460.1 DUF2783 domain-containing protein [Moraxella sp. FZLJ2107]UTO22196.1 DUF2783 domain-containing protein [Moraxella sp. FZLJ2109]
MKQLTTQELETIYDALATALDGINEEKQLLFLTKLTLLLANEVGDLPVIETAIKSAATFEN